MKKTFYTALTALSLVAAPTMAVAAPMAAAPVATPLTQTASETVSGDEELRGNSSGFIIVALAVIAIGLGIYVAVDNGSAPNSP